MNSQDFSVDLDETDLALINALQLDPRAPWSVVARALDVDAVTAARRWQRLESSGSAWVAAQPMGPGYAAYVEVDCVTGRVEEIARTLARWPHVWTIDLTTGNRHLMLLVCVSGFSDLSRFLYQALDVLDGVVSWRTQLITQIYSTADSWELRALDVEQRARIGASSRASHSTGRTPEAVEQAMLSLLSVDGRMSLTELAARTGCAVSTARRRLNTMIDTGVLSFRCDIARSLSGWPVSFWLWSRIPAALTEQAARTLSRLPETRTCMGLTGGTSNLLLCLSLRSVEDASRLEEQIIAACSGLIVVDRAIALDGVKRMGRVLDGSGRAIDTVPLGLAVDPVEAARAALADGLPPTRTRRG